MILVQETHVCTIQVGRCRTVADGAGCHSAWAAALPHADTGFATGGIAILWEKAIPVIGVPEEVIPGRLLLVPSHVGKYGRVLIGSFYGPTSGQGWEGLSSTQTYGRMVC